MSGPAMHANSGAARLAQALDPASCPVDARDSRDRLAFVAELARLVLYYDAQNRLAGDWQPFFLKDPAILLAAIGKTDYKSGHVQFVQLGQRFSSAGEGERIALINDLCRLLREVFVTLNRWLHFMQRGGRDYPLCAFLKKKIQASLSGQLWTMVACQQYLGIQTDGQVERPDTATYQGFEAAWARDMPVWRPDGDPLAAGWKTLSAAWLAVFDVLVQTVEQASAQFYAQVDNPTRFPDTALLIAFSALMDKQRALLNGYGQQHLDFYYSQVLQQTALPAQPDEVFVFLSLKAAATSLALPQGAEFTAGTYPDNSDIVFASDAPAEINQVAIASACALYYQPQAPGPGLYLTQCGNPAQQPPPWPAFGDAGGTPVRQGFALASPMLLLQGGSRDITITLEFAAAPPAGLFDGATCYLSTGTAWLTVPPAQVTLAPSSIKIKLLPTDPPIVAFTQPQDGLSSDWPMFRLLLGPAANLLEPPSLSQVKIDVTVGGLAQLALANDVSPLPDTGPAAMFGPVPELGNCFYVGSREVFAKPVETLGLTIYWDNLVADFADYYQDYNTYLMSRPASATPLQTFDNNAFRGQWSLLLAPGWEPLLPATPPPVPGSLAPTCLFQQATPALASTPAPTPAPAPANPPNLAQSTFTFIPTSDAPIPAVPDLARSALPPPLQATAGYLRFALLAPAWAFGYELYPKLVSHISLQNAQTLIDMAKQPSLLSRIWAAIKKFVAGIGAAIKKIGQAVVAVFKKIGAWIKKILGKPAEEGTGTSGTPQPTPAPGPALLEMPNLPYSPRQAGVSVDYTASSTATMSSAAPASDAQPLQLFHVGPFQSCLAFDAGVAGGLGFAACAPGASAGSLPLFPGVGGQGVLYLALDGVSSACTLSLFLEVCCGADDDGADWFCWGATGWQPVTLLEDGTDGLRRSGIVRLALPAPAPCPVMPSGKYWLALASGKTAPGITLGYVQTQALRLRRTDASMFAPGQVPQIDANAITAMRNQPPTIAAILQPFPSAGGLPAETQDSFGGAASFYRRVAARLNHKDRCSSLRNYEDMAYGASQDLYFARALADEDGQVTVGLVNRYADATLPNAWRPVVNAAELDALQQYFAQRVSAMAQPCVAGFSYQEVTVKATLVVASDASQATLLAELGQWLRLYLSPWIASDRPQMDMALGLTSSGVIAVLRSHPQVLSIAAFSLLDAAGAVLQPGPGGVLTPEPGAMFVSAMEHALTVAAPAPPGSATGQDGNATAVAAGEEVAA